MPSSSTTPTSLTPAHNTPSRQNVISRTKATLANKIQRNDDWLIQLPPTVHPERHLSEVIADNDLPITYLSPVDEGQGRMVQQCKDQGLSVRRISSQKNLCPSYNGDHGEERADRIKAICREQGTSLGYLHRTAELPCQPGCPFTTNPNRTVNQCDVLVGPPTIAYMDTARENRTIIVDGLTGDEFVTPIEAPAKQLSPYIRDKTDLSGYDEFIRRRDKPTFDDYACGPLRADQIDGERALEKEGHVHAPLAVFGLLFTETLNNGWETTCYHRNTSYGGVPTNRCEGPADRWEVAELDYNRHRVVRDPGDDPDDDTIHLLQLPDFSTTNGVIGLDVAPVPWVWNACYGRYFKHESVLHADETRRFLRRTMDISVIQTADSHKPYDGTNVTAGRDGSVTVWASAECGKKPVVISTKNALTDAYPEHDSALLESDASNQRQYRGDDGRITQQSPVILAHGAPRPPNRVFQMWGAFQGESVPAESNQNNSFGEVGDKIRRQFMHARIARAVTNVGENGRDATIVLNTTAVPEWLHAPSDTETDPTNILPENAYAKRRVARYLRRQSQDGRAASIGVIREDTGVSETVVREATKLFMEQGWVTEHDFSGYPTEYEWTP